MKKNIHPEYNTKAVITCVCGHKFEAGSTKDSIEVEVCSACHPFYTGQEKVMDSAGRVEKFKERARRAEKVAKQEQAAETPEADSQEQEA